VNRLLRLGILFSCLLLSAIVAAQKWTIYKPGNTGIGGTLVESLALDPSGHPWVGARYPIQQDGGVAMFDFAKWTNYSNVDGKMPSEYVYATAFASDGTRWHGTDLGLVHHFGDHFELFNSLNSPLPKNFIRSVKVDSGGAVWMVYWDPGFITTGVARFDGANWSVWPHNSSMGLGDTIALDNIAIDAGGKVWVGTDSPKGLARWDGTKWTRVLPSATASGPFQPYLGRDNRVWALCGNEVRVLDAGTWLAKPTPAGDGQDWMSLHAKADGTYYLGSWNGLLAYNGGSSWQTLQTPAPVMEIVSDTAGQVWWSSLKQLYKFVDWSSWRAYSAANTGLTNYFSDSIAFDPSGKLWVGTSGGGACTFDGQAWKGYNPYNNGFEPWGLQTDFVTEILTADDGSIWAALGSGAARFDGSTWSSYSPGFGMSDLALGVGGAIYGTWDINTDRGYSRFNGSDFLRTSLAGDPNHAGEPYDIYVDADGIYLATATGLLTNETGTWVRKEMNSVHGQGSFAAYLVTKSPNGDLWVGTEFGLAKRHAGNWTLLTKENSGLPANNITAIGFRADGLMAVGAFDGSVWPYNGGVTLFDGTTWKTFTYANSPIQHEQVADVAFDPSGDLWIVSQSEGIAKIALSSDSGASTLSEVTLLPSEMAGGLATKGTVWLSAPAPAGGSTVALASGSTLATIPASVTVKAGTKKATFIVKTKMVDSDSSVAISASLNGVVRSASLKLLTCAAGFYGQSVPLTLQPGEKADVMVTYRNMGTATWTSNTVQLVSISPRNNKTWGIDRLTLNPLLTTKPMELGNFMGTVTAPTVPGVYTFRWQPLLVGNGTFGEPSIKLTITVKPAENMAAFVGQSVPLSVKAGTLFSASITMRNIGTANWSASSGYGLVSLNPTGNSVWGRSKVPLPATASIAPGSEITFRNSYRAPVTPGTYHFQWRMQQTGKALFGEPTTDVEIVVEP
jgi:ligand-binding sensor domain-containing protein